VLRAQICAESSEESVQKVDVNDGNLKIFIVEFITVPHEISGRLNIPQMSPFGRRQCYLTRRDIWADFQQATLEK